MKSPVNNKGYTLIEILVVMVIISIVVVAATLTVSFNTNKQVETFTQDLTDLLLLTEEEAVLRPAVLGVSFSKDHFQFYEYQNKQWRPLQEKILGEHEIPSGIVFSIDKKEMVPQILFTPSSESTAFHIDIGKAGEKPRYQIKGEDNGRIRAEKI